MPFYASADDFYRVMETLFTRLLRGGKLSSGGARLRIYITVTQPGAHLLINMRTSPPQVSFGPATGLFDLEASVSGDTLHAIWTKELRLRDALASGRLRVKGNALKAQALRPIFEAAQALYPTVLAEHGLAPLPD